MTPGFEWSRPLALWSLLLPLLVLVLSFRRDRQPPRPLGTFALWQHLSVALGETRAWRVPPARWLWILALIAGCLALAGPRLRSESSPEVLTVVVDRSPSMYLPHTLADGSASAQGTRLDAGLSALADLLTDPACAGFDQARIRWRERTSSGDGSVVQGAFPDSWRVPPQVAAQDPSPWARFDRDGWLWLTDQLDGSPKRAGWVASGGGPVFGPVGMAGGKTIAWDGSQLRIQDGPRESLRVRLDPDLPPSVAGLTQEWAATRGYVAEILPREAPAPGGVPATLRVHAIVPPPASPARRVGRDGWSVSGPLADVPARDGTQPLDTWLTSETGAPVVAWSEGHVFAGLSSAAPDGDPAAFAVSWSHLLDRASRLPPGVQPVAIRRAVERASLRAPGRSTAALVQSEVGSSELTPWVALAAALFGWLALLLGGALLR